MPICIDWKFIASPEIEGRNPCAVVPDAAHSHSGVTVGMGIDLGQMTSGEMLQMGLPRELLIKCISYAGLKGEVAKTALAATPLILTSAECDLLEAPKKKAMTITLSRQFLRDAAEMFESLAQGPQTVAMSLQWQYGDVAEKCPKFWQAFVKKDWMLVGEELGAFGDRYQPRHDAEAAYLKAHLT